MSIYLFGFAADRYTATIGMSVRSEEAVDSGLIDGLSAFSGGARPDSAILHGFLTSADLVNRLDRRIGLKDRLIPPKFDPVYAQNPQSLEGLHQRWLRLVTATHDSRSGIVTLRVSGFSSSDALLISNAVNGESAAMLTRLSEQMRAESTGLARAESARAEARLRAAQDRLATFRASSQIADPTAEFEGLQIEVEYARERYFQARAALDATLVQAQKTGRYLAVHIEPVQPESAELPRKGQVLWVSGIVLLLIWGVGVLGVKGLQDA